MFFLPLKFLFQQSKQSNLLYTFLHFPYWNEQVTTITGIWCITDCIYSKPQSFCNPTSQINTSKSQHGEKKELHRKTNILLSSVPFGGSCGSCRPLLLFTGVPVGLVWTDPPRGCALVHKTQSPLLLLFCACTLFP